MRSLRLALVLSLALLPFAAAAHRHASKPTPINQLNMSGPPGSGFPCPPCIPDDEATVQKSISTRR